MIGGGQIDETVRAYTGADAFGVNAVEAVALCKGWMGAGNDRDRRDRARAERKRLRRALAAHHGLRRADASPIACR